MKILPQKRRDELDHMLMAFPRLGEGYRLKELFSTVWELGKTEEALVFLTY